MYVYIGPTVLLSHRRLLGRAGGQASLHVDCQRQRHDQRRLRVHHAPTGEINNRPHPLEIVARGWYSGGMVCRLARSTFRKTTNKSPGGLFLSTCLWMRELSEGGGLHIFQLRDRAATYVLQIGRSNGSKLQILAHVSCSMQCLQGS